MEGAGIQKRGTAGRQHLAARPRMARPVGSVWRFGGARNLRCNVRPRTETGIDKSLVCEPGERVAIKGEAGGLPANRLLPIEPEPAQILKNRLHEFFAGAAGIEILDAEEKAASSRRFACHDRRKGVAKMQITCWTGCEARDNHGA